jgi:hypothetical protein
MDAISENIGPSSDRLPWVKMLRTYLLLILFGLGLYALSESDNYSQTGRYHVPGKSLWSYFVSYFWQSSFISSVIVLVGYWRQILLTLKSKTNLHRSN